MDLQDLPRVLREAFFLARRCATRAFSGGGARTRGAAAAATTPRAV